MSDTKGDQGDQGEQGIQGDRGAQGDHGDQGGQGDRGAQGFRGDRGLRGERGADSDSIEVLTEVLDGLRSELRGLRMDVRQERRGRRLSLAVIGVAFVLVTIVVAAGWVEYLHSSERDRAQVRTAQVESMRRDFDQRTAQHTTCLKRNDLRTGVRTLFFNLYDQFQAVVPAVPRTPAEQAQIDEFLTGARCRPGAAG
jgi:hypothetical protein